MNHYCNTPFLLFFFCLQAVTITPQAIDATTQKVKIQFQRWRVPDMKTSTSMHGNVPRFIVVIGCTTSYNIIIIPSISIHINYKSRRDIIVLFLHRHVGQASRSILFPFVHASIFWNRSSLICPCLRIDLMELKLHRFIFCSCTALDEGQLRCRFRAPETLLRAIDDTTFEGLW